MYKPSVPLAQREAQLSRFDDTVKPRNAAQRESSDPARASAEPVVPGYLEAKYNPSDPRADWSGLVKTLPGKSHIRGRAQESTLVRSEDGIVGEPPRPKDSRRHYTVPSATPWGVSGDRDYLTTTQAAQLGKQTDPDFFGPTTRHKGKRFVRPPYEDSVFAHPDQPIPSSSVSSSSKSMIARAASSLVDVVEAPPPIPIAARTKIDPHSDFINHVPGYTGIRR